MLNFGRHKTESLGADRAWRLVGVALLVIVALSIFQALNANDASLHQDSEPVGFHANLANALIGGNLDLGPAPDGLLALADPWDPEANQPIRTNQGLHDYALFEGRIYSPFGPTPAVLLQVPFRLLTGGFLDSGIATAVWALGQFIASFLAYRMLADRFAPQRPVWSDLSAVAALFLAGPILWLISIGRSYEESIACGAFLLMSGIACLARSTTELDRASPVSLGTAGLLLGLAAGARPHLVGAGLLIAFTALWLVRHRPSNWKHGMSALIAPYCLIILLLSSYNQMRFGTPLEFGTSYQMAGMDLREYPLFDPSHLIPNLRDYLVGGPRFESSWPYVHLLHNTFINNPTRHANEPVAGMLTTFPVIAVGLRCLPRAICRKASMSAAISFQLGILLAVGIGILVSVSIPFSSSTMRYTIDFVPVFALVGLVAALTCLGETDGSNSHRLFRRIWLAALAWSAGVGVLLTFSPCQGTGSC